MQRSCSRCIARRTRARVVGTRPAAYAREDERFCVRFVCVPQRPTWFNWAGWVQMPITHIALLRAVNVGGRAVVRMTDLREAFVAAGCTNVRTFIQSGNVVFDARTQMPAALLARIRVSMTTLLGAEPGICFRTRDDLDRIVASNPFGELANDRTLKLYVSFCDREPAKAPILPFAVPKELIEVIAHRGRELFIVSRRKPSGMYGFPNAVVENLGVTATTRNWNTVTKLAAFAHA